ncbi:C-type lectin mannose-binding isoform-like [Protopterus annectens]|uniref:C-type lectin mannose-binding isoform-like n=1 Tax=Protopterus annectens TaxID=7888 RepID=UPI001CF97D84|nr:C-type lectin mannose-binding isoform-like [Protopterus annectens]
MLLWITFSSSLATDCSKSATFWDRKYILTENYLNWTQASTYCKTVYSSLFSTRSSNDQDDARQFLLTTYGGRVWIGLFQIANAPDWMWSDNVTSDIMYWDSDLPTSTHNQEMCVEMHLKSDQYVWSYMDCSTLLYFLCYQAIPPYTTTTSQGTGLSPKTTGPTDKMYRTRVYLFMNVSTDGDIDVLATKDAFIAKLQEMLSKQLKTKRLLISENGIWKN